MDLGCNGGALLWVWNYLLDYGAVEEECFPYTSQTGTVEKCIHECKNGAPWKKYHVSDWGIYTGITQIRKEIVANGPVDTGFMVYSDFMNYKSGIYEYKSGTLQGGKI